MGRNNKEVSPKTRVEKRRLYARVKELLRRKFEPQPPAGELSTLLRLRDLTADGRPIPDDLRNKLGDDSCRPEKMHEAILEGNRLGFKRLEEQLRNGGQKR